MASYDDIESGSLDNLGQIIAGMTINTAMTMARNLMTDLSSANIGSFNEMNHDFMTIHMMRNTYEKIITLNTVGENAYINGDGDATATPALYPSYTRGNNYMEFVTDVHDGSKIGEMTTRIQKAGGENKNLYLDYEGEDSEDIQPRFTGKYTDKNSILYKTKRLMRQNKIKTIISQFHTDGVEYNGQIGSKGFGESHGRNLLKKNAEGTASGKGGYSGKGYDNPYCRVWTHHYKYDNLEKTIRGENGDINVWDNFFWGTETYVKDNNNKVKKVKDSHNEDITEYGGVQGENYDYAWRGKHNQDRRKKNSVLDPKSTGTNLVNITPKYLGGGNKNIHTKSCMFSIENLAWKDYDPYSFEQALSWEQRGPFGGRIMWFPPYGIEINETSTAKWNPNEFIGRGEPVYTYVNSERKGNLSFIMLTDHPSSVDYASWWDDNNETENNTRDRKNGNAENDYLRYFAGCFDKDIDNKDDMSGGLHLTPTYLTGEYIKTNPPLVKPEEVKKEEPENRKSLPKSPITVEFYVYFPNNYSGVNDFTCVREKSNGSEVNSIVYLLAGRNAQKTGNTGADFRKYANKDNPLNENTNLNGDGFIGYEMGANSITTSDCVTKGEFIQGTKDRDRKWQYRVDHRQPISSVDEPDNTLNQRVFGDSLKDLKSFGLNLRVQEKYSQNESMYSFAEVAAAFYKLEGNEKPNIYNYLIGKGVNETKVNKLLEIFTNQELIKVDCKGWANWQGVPESKTIKDKKTLEYKIDKGNKRNQALASNRGNTIATWLTNYTKWSNRKDDIKSEFEVKNAPENIKNYSDENSLTAKEYRCAHCILTFAVEQATEENNPNVPTEPKKDYPEYVGFKYIESKPQSNGEVWHYYEKTVSCNYYKQKPKPTNTYDKGDTTDVVVNVDKLYDIFKDDKFKPKKESCITEEGESYSYTFNWELTSIVEKVAALTCKTVEYTINKITGGDDYVYNDDKTYSNIWKYGEVNNLYENFGTDTNLVAFVESLEPDSHPESSVVNPKIRLNESEDKYINALISNGKIDIDTTDVKQTVYNYIIMHRVLDGIQKINDGGERDVCQDPARDNDEMEMKTKTKDMFDNCNTNRWVDRNDGMLIQECYINKNNPSSSKTNERNTDLNKLRYDQEYHFYQQYAITHSFMFEKLQEKLKYFNPAFHSMTPEGFNARCTFLQQCTRQGNTKTMSDLSGKTANNLAFGRPPYCVLRLGDFYYQMIVINDVSFDYNVSEGLQWDLNPEGNGVQPMLCKVSISFNFIGGGDITGPVQRLQNAMSFNYYANTSFYDNRADRVEYKPTNWETMGGAGNDGVDTERSYAYLAKNYENNQNNIYTTKPKQ